MFKFNDKQQQNNNNFIKLTFKRVSITLNIIIKTRL